MSFNRALLPDPTVYFEGRGLVLMGPRSSKWKTTRCEFHGGSDSMRINIATGAWVCMSCGAKGGDVLAYEINLEGRDFIDAAKCLGCWEDDGRPQVISRPTPLSPRMALSVMAFESTLAAVAAANVSNGVVLTDQDRNRLMLAANRINSLVEAFV